MSNCEVPPIPSAIRAMIERLRERSFDGKLFCSLFNYFVAEMDPKTPIEWICLVRLAEGECSAICLREYRALVIEQERKTSMLKQLGPKKKSFTLAEFKQLSREAKRLRENPRFPHKLLSATAVVGASNELQKLDALIERVDYQCTGLREECEALAHRALRATVSPQARQTFGRGAAPILTSTVLLGETAISSTENPVTGNEKDLDGEIIPPEVPSNAVGVVEPVEQPQKPAG